MDRQIARIRALNDQFRTTLQGGRVMLTQNVAALPLDMQRVILETLKSFDAFGIDNDPYHEHDFGAFELYETKFFFKIDTYEKGTDYMVGAEHPENAATTDRVLTIMFAEDY